MTKAKKLIHNTPTRDSNAKVELLVYEALGECCHTIEDVAKYTKLSATCVKVVLRILVLAGCVERTGIPSAGYKFHIIY